MSAIRAQVRRLIARYEHANSRYPIAVRGTIGVGLFFASDVIAQRTQHVYYAASS